MSKEIPQEIKAQIEQEAENYKNVFRAVTDKEKADLDLRENDFRNGAVFGYGLAQQEIESKYARIIRLMLLLELQFKKSVPANTTDSLDEIFERDEDRWNQFKNKHNL